MTNLKLVEEARSWVGTPFFHRQGQRAKGCDCFGLISGVYEATKGAFPIDRPPYSHPKSLRAHLGVSPQIFTKAFDKIDKPALGSLLVFELKARRQWHLGLLTEEGGSPKMIHADSHFGVIEEAFSNRWAQRLHSIFSLI